jgi:hypothetical protein
MVILSIVICLMMATSACSIFTPKEPEPSMTGTWYDPDSDHVFQITWLKGKYMVVSAKWQDESFLIVDQKRSKDKVTWTYIDRINSKHITIETGPYTQDYIIALKTIGNLREYTVQLFRLETITVD